MRSGVMKRKKHKYVSKQVREEVYRMYGNRCINCGDSKNIELHHVVPLEIGGNDVTTNMVPLRHACHKAVTHHDLTLSTFSREHGLAGGRPKHKPDNCEAIFEDYVRRRISKSEAAKRLGKGEHFPDLAIFKKYKKDNGVVFQKNNIDIRLGTGGLESLQEGILVGSIEYINGRVEKLYYGAEKPISGELIPAEPNRTSPKKFDATLVNIDEKIRPVRKFNTSKLKVNESDCSTSEEWWRRYIRQYLS